MIHGIIQAVQQFMKRVPRAVSLTTTALAILLGFLVFYLGQGLEAIDAFYLTIVTISTVGYGDVSPSGACTDSQKDAAKMPQVVRMRAKKTGPSHPAQPTIRRQELPTSRGTGLASTPRM